ncbi:MAG: bifunctional adenosylcobinamide kinase/adenosylcobinamide-phosphate guanylyltransferase [Thermoguttaceae bacterium]|jgi:adenosylcobinamide kinase/adenosylcobinamide-phosphate guanylyltransferase
MILITGGCRSGKSAYAQHLGESLGRRRAFVATAPATDDEMRARIEAHRRFRHGRGWETIEEQLDLAGVLRGHPQYDLLLVDCITLWVNNLMYHNAPGSPALDEHAIARRCKEIIDAAQARSGTLLFVTNEVGMGIVPENAAARRYRDLVGWANRLLAASAATVTLISCGIPWHLKQDRGDCPDFRAATACDRSENGTAPLHGGEQE